MHYMKEHFNHIIQNGTTEQMNELHSVVLQAIGYLKEINPNKYCEIKDKVYMIAYGEQLNEELASRWVDSMTPDGEYWTIDQTTSVAKQYGITFDKISKETWYAIMNMARNDFSEVLGSSVDVYVKYAKAWLMDEDYPYPNKKAYKYYKLVEKG